MYDRESHNYNLAFFKTPNSLCSLLAIVAGRKFSLLDVRIKSSNSPSDLYIPLLNMRVGGWPLLLNIY